MRSSLTADVLERDGVSYLRLAGVIDERNDLASFSDRVNNSTLVINLANVSRINSCGVRDWIMWLAELEKRGVVAYLDECAPPLVLQLSQVANFSGHAKVLSVLCPYYCGPPCETERLRLLTRAEANATGTPKAPSVSCDRCGHEMEFDEYEAQFLGWFDNEDAVELPPAVSGAIAAFSRADQLLRERESPAGAPTAKVEPPAHATDAATIKTQVPAEIAAEAGLVPQAEDPGQQPLAGARTTTQGATEAAVSNLQSKASAAPVKADLRAYALAAAALVAAIALLLFAIFF